MRSFLIFGAVAAGLAGSAFLLTRDRAEAYFNPPPTLVALESTLDRPIVLYVDGQVPDTFRQSLDALDTGVGALDKGATPRRLVDLDSYVMVRKDWDAFRTLDNHDLAPVIRKQTETKTDLTSATWFEADLSASDGAQNKVLVVLATQAALDTLGPFCFAMTVHDLARFAHNGKAFQDANAREDARWKQCKAKGWTSVADMAEQS